MKTLLSTLLFFAFPCFGMHLGSHLLEEETPIAHFFKTYEGQPLPANLQKVDCIYVLNLAKRPEKWKNTQKQLAPYAIQVNRFEGIDGWDLSDQAVCEIFNWKIPCLPKGKVGCILSHLSVIQDAYDRGYNCIWILQDDIEVRRDPIVIDDYLGKLENFDPDWGLLFTDLDMRNYSEAEGKYLRALSLDNAYRENQEVKPLNWYLQRRNVGNDFQLIRLRYGFHSVLISRRGMEEILHYFKHVVLHISFDIDVHFIEGLRKYGMRKPVIVNTVNWKISDSEAYLPEISSLPEPYCQLPEILPFHSYGRGFFDTTGKLEEKVKKGWPKVAVGLGSFPRKSTCELVKMLPKTCKLYAIGQWQGREEQHLYHQFLSNIIHEDLMDQIIPIFLTSDDAAEQFRQEKIEIDFLFFDAMREKESIDRVLCTWAPLLSEGGIICGRGLFAQKEVKHFAEKHGWKYENLSSTFWMLKGPAAW